MIYYELRTLTLLWNHQLWNHHDLELTLHYPHHCHLQKRRKETHAVPTTNDLFSTRMSEANTKINQLYKASQTGSSAKWQCSFGLFFFFFFFSWKMDVLYLNHSLSNVRGFAILEFSQSLWQNIALGYRHIPQQKGYQNIWPFPFPSLSTSVLNKTPILVSKLQPLVTWQEKVARSISYLLFLTTKKVNKMSFLNLGNQNFYHTI